METIHKIFLYVFLLINVAVMYFPSCFTKKLEIIRWKNLKKECPKSAWIRWAFLPMYLCWLGILFYAPKVFATILDIKLSIFWYLNSFAAIGFFYGLFSVITKVLVIPTSGPILLFATGSEAFKLARIQLITSMGVIVVNSLILFFTLR